MRKSILERLSEGVVLGDGGYIVELEKRGFVTAGAFTPELALTHPEAIKEMHCEFLNAGAEVLQVMAFYGSREKLATVGKAERTFEINQAATRLAKEVACSKAHGAWRPQRNMEVAARQPLGTVPGGGDV